MQKEEQGIERFNFFFLSPRVIGDQHVNPRVELRDRSAETPFL